MATCKLFENCIFFNRQMANMPATTEAYIKAFCQQRFERCARYHVAESIGRSHVPEDLFPDDMRRAEELVAEVRSG